MHPNESYEVYATCHMDLLALHLQPSCQHSVELSHFVTMSFETRSESLFSAQSCLPCSAIKGSHVRVFSTHVCILSTL